MTSYREAVEAGEESVALVKRLGGAEERARQVAADRLEDLAAAAPEKDRAAMRSAARTVRWGHH